MNNPRLALLKVALYRIVDRAPGDWDGNVLLSQENRRSCFLSGVAMLQSLSGYETVESRQLISEEGGLIIDGYCPSLTEAMERIRFGSGHEWQRQQLLR